MVPIQNSHLLLVSVANYIEKQQFSVVRPWHSIKGIKSAVTTIDIDIIVVVWKEQQSYLVQINCLAKLRFYLDPTQRQYAEGKAPKIHFPSSIRNNNAKLFSLKEKKKRKKRTTDADIFNFTSDTHYIPYTKFGQISTARCQLWYCAKSNRITTGSVKIFAPHKNQNFLGKNHIFPRDIMCNDCMKWLCKWVKCFFELKIVGFPWKH